MTAYEVLLQDVLDNGETKGDRTGTGTISVFGRQIRFDLSEGFPLITSKELNFANIAEELLWFLRGESNIKPLLEKKVNIWNDWPFVEYLKATGQPAPKPHSPEWKKGMAEFKRLVLEDKDDFAARYGSAGRIYGVQWRTWRTPDGGVVDQIDELIKEIKRNPNSRRLIVSAWNAGELDQMSLTPCHAMFQFYVVNGKLSCQLYQRSADMFLGVPYNIASYALLIHMIAQQCDLEVGEFIWTGGDTHIYLNHLAQVHEQLSREERPLPKFALKRKPDSIFDYTMDDFLVLGYVPHPAIRGEVSV